MSCVVCSGLWMRQGGIKAKIKGPKSVQLRDKVDMIAYKRETTAQDGSQPLRFPFLVFFAPKEDEYRKPDQGMFQYFLENFQGFLRWVITLFYMRMKTLLENSFV